ncbi:MAG: hypothetical protein DHS20C07_12980 [Methyloligella sp.]|nr:MAG: hypothetical protein DHS20C07_12980 [Methyloligella sp.]
MASTLKVLKFRLLIKRALVVLRGQSLLKKGIKKAKDKLFFSLTAIPPLKRWASEGAAHTPDASGVMYAL